MPSSCTELAATIWSFKSVKTFLASTGFSAFFRMSIFWILPLSNVTATWISPCLPTPTPCVVTGAAKAAAAAKAKAAAKIDWVNFITISSLISRLVSWKSPTIAAASSCGNALLNQNKVTCIRWEALCSANLKIVIGVLSYMLRKHSEKGGDSQRESPPFKGLIRTPYLPLSDSSQ